MFGLYSDLPPPSTGAADPSALLPAVEARPSHEEETAPVVTPSSPSTTQTGGTVAPIKAKGLETPRQLFLRPTAVHCKAAAQPTSKPKAVPAAVSTTRSLPSRTEDSLDGASLQAAAELKPSVMLLHAVTADEYDPARPNDYEQHCRQRERQFRLEQQRREREMERGATHAPGVAAAVAGISVVVTAIHERERSPTPPSPRHSNLKVSGEEAYRLRGQLSSEPRGLPKDISGEEAYRLRGQLSSGPRKDLSGEDAYRYRGGIRNEVGDEPKPTKQASAALRMMERMGWKEGHGLGRGTLSAAAGPSEKRIKTAASPRPTRVLLLQNMVAPGDVDDDLQAETQEESQRFGKVVGCLIFEVTDGSVREEEAVRIFVEFESLQSSQKAFDALDGRFFGGRLVRASYFSEDKYRRCELAP